jgi:hypothetical protein
MPDIIPSYSFWSLPEERESFMSAIPVRALG